MTNVAVVVKVLKCGDTGVAVQGRFSRPGHGLSLLSLIDCGRIITAETNNALSGCRYQRLRWFGRRNLMVGVIHLRLGRICRF